uniref:CSON004423 protein n=1 Tax=Culicoides sonorensis TaxID=179676 RepID=A0A336MP00_CULSO
MFIPNIRHIFLLNSSKSTTKVIAFSVKLNFNHIFARPPSSSLSYGAMNDDVRSPGSGSTPGPLSAQGPPGLDTSDPVVTDKSYFGKWYDLRLFDINYIIIL